jgi:ferredoxin
VLRPPGAATESRFTGLCARCGNCLRACPERILHPDAGESGLSGLLTPVVRFGPGYCRPQCTACGEACPSQAIARLTPGAKRYAPIGLAVVVPRLCIAHTGEYCVICSERCPEKAITEDISKGFPTPRVLAERCTGCGLCLLKCPAPGALKVIPPAGRA